MPKYTPMLRQYLSIKNNYQDCILFFRLGDFYEMFFDDAIYASETLNIVLTARDGGGGKKIPMCGVPFHSADSYIQKLIDAKQRVAICEQVEDASKAKGLVKRDVVRIITPGTLTDGEYLKPDKNNYLMSIYIDSNKAGYSLIDVSTGHFSSGEFISENSIELLVDELLKASPAELIVNCDIAEYPLLNSVVKSNTILLNIIQNIDLNALADITDHIDMSKTKTMSLGLDSAYYLLSYLSKTQAGILSRITTIQRIDNALFMKIDNITKRNLELTETMRDNTKRGSLFWLLDSAITPMGSRLLRNWILNPLLNVNEINQRQLTVKEFNNNSLLLVNTRNTLSKITDIERIIGKIAVGKANGKDLRVLVNSLKEVETLRGIFENCNSNLLKELAISLNGLYDFALWLDKAIAEDPPTSIRDGGIIADGFNEKVDYYRNIQRSGKSWIASLEATERKNTGIKSLKIGFNKVFGYYLEVTRANLHLVPEHYQRKQTLSNSERFITPNLKQKEEDILTAEEKLIEIEQDIFKELIQAILGQVCLLQQISNAVAAIDVLANFAYISEKYNFVCPDISNKRQINIVEGRHAVIEQVLKNGSFVPNTVNITNSVFFHLITGPNMSGKSTYMRQIALIILMAQIGCFVPATSASIGIVDRLFTRVGASDDIFSGHSTFMVEMQEVANICKNATDRSFVILDEIGRGTSTYDGMSIARAVSEYLYNINCRVLFATHYHELTDLTDNYPGIANYSVAVHENGQDIVFLHKIVAGPSNRSYGIHVCKLAGIPPQVIECASRYLTELESSTKEVAVHAQAENEKKDTKPYQNIINEISNINAENITPFNALTFIFKWQSELQKTKES